MKTLTEKPKIQATQAGHGGNTRERGAGTAAFADRRPEAAVHESAKRLADSGPQARGIAQMQSIADQGTPNRTGLPDTLKAGIENLSVYSMDDVRTHYNSGKPAQLNAHAYAQGTDIHIAPGQEKHLPHEAWHVVQQKQGRVRPTVQLQGGLNVNDDAGLEEEADVMGWAALSHAKNNDNETRAATPSLGSVFQRQLIVNDTEVDKGIIRAYMVENTKWPIHGWLTSEGMKAMLKRNKKLKAEITATESNIKATKYLNANLGQQIDALLAKYDIENRTFKDNAQLESQLIQDVKLSILRLDSVLGTDHHDGQFSPTDRSGGSKPLRIYRTTTRADWNAYLQSKDVGGLLHGHGGSLGQALDYFYKSKNSDKDGPLYDNVIFELKFSQNASDAIDYDEISSGGEGGGPTGGKLTGKKEQNDILREANIFSVNLAACRDLILSMNPIVRRVDEMQGEDSQYSKRLLELALKHGEYPPQNLTEEETTELERLRDVG